MKFVIFHGSFSNPESNWFPELKEKLQALGQEVLAPKFPTDDYDKLTKKGPVNQSLSSWLKTFKKEVLPKINKGEKLCFIGHSLGPVFMLHLVLKYNLSLDCAIFVSPFMEDIKNDSWQFYQVNKTFYKNNFDFKKLKKLIPLSYTLYSDNDPYVDKKYSLDFANKLKSSSIVVNKGGHMNAEVNLNEFPLVLELCKSRLDLNLYQKYLAHRKELYDIDYIKGTTEEVIYIKLRDVFDEGIFKFRNLRRSGFCTFYTALSFWNTQSGYLQEARKAARRIKSFIRVFVLDNIKDLNKPLLREQIKLDLNYGMSCYLVMWNDLKNIKCEPDFGVWDDEYLCIVEVKKNQTPKHLRLSSRKTDIEKGNQWKGQILKKAVQVINADKDLDDFILKHNKPPHHHC